MFRYLDKIVPVEYPCKDAHLLTEQCKVELSHRGLDAVRAPFHLNWLPPVRYPLEGSKLGPLEGGLPQTVLIVDVVALDLGTFRLTVVVTKVLNKTEGDLPVPLMAACEVQQDSESVRGQTGLNGCQ